MDEAVRRVFIVGDSLFAETVAQLLGRSSALSMVGTAGDVTGALPLLAVCQPDLVIVLSSGDRYDLDLCPLLTDYPDLPIVRADLSANELRIIHSQRLEARASDLLAAIRSLPARR
ncbi:MAG: hypothetical protein QM346_05930 [Chloroflexota bacterium]|nr:hypothetical protein [Chloroflexota bacterium]